MACSAVFASGCVGPAPLPEPTTAVEASVEESEDHDLARQVWGLKPAPQDPEPVQERDAEQDPATLRSRFGSTILMAADGSITKQYFLTGESGQVFLNLLREPEALAVVPQKPGELRPAPKGPVRVGGAGSSNSVLAQMLGEQEVEVFYLENFEQPAAVQIRPTAENIKNKKWWDGKPPREERGAANNLLLVTAQPDALAAFEGALNLFFANIPQVEIEIKVVEYSTSDTLAFGVQPVDATTPTLAQGSSNKLIGDIISQFPLAAPSFTGTPFSDRGILTLGGVHDSWTLAAQLEALEANGVADILSSPRLVVRNGGWASVTTKTDFPYPQARISSSGQNVTSNIAFRPVGVTLNIRPVIAGTGTVILQIYANVSAVTSFAETSPVDTPVISGREIVTSVHVSDGNTTVIGGLVTSNTFEQTSQVPILGDIPILGYLFRSTSTSTNKTTLQFHITPRILRDERSYVGG